MMSKSEFDQAEASYLAARAHYERTLRSLRVAELGYRQEEIAAAEAEVQRLQAKVHRGDVRKRCFTRCRGSYEPYAEVGQWLDREGKMADIVDLAGRAVPITSDIRLIWARRRGGGHSGCAPNQTFTGTHITPQTDLAKPFPIKIEVEYSNTAIKAGFAQVTCVLARPSQCIRTKDAGARLVDRWCLCGGHQVRLRRSRPGGPTKAYRGG
jgi:hypothetical protein